MLLLVPFVFAVSGRFVPVVPVVRTFCPFCRRSCSGRPVDLAGSCRLEFLDPWLCVEMRNVGSGIEGLKAL
ncbi:hypothetical protein Hanom_Chr01g00010531 [Helianthus anomalus]